MNFFVTQKQEWIIVGTKYGNMKNLIITKIIENFSHHLNECSHIVMGLCIGICDCFGKRQEL